MTTPPGPGDRPEDEPRDENEGYPYGPTDHPEDAPGGYNPGAWNQGASDPYQGYGAQGYPQFPNSDGNYNQYGQPSTPGDPVRQTDGRVNVMEAVRFGFRYTFRNPGTWLLGSFLMLLVVFIGAIFLTLILSLMMGSGAADPSDVSAVDIILNVIVMAGSLAITIFAMNGTLLEASGRRPSLGDLFRNVNFWPTFVLFALISIIGGVIGSLVLAPLSAAMTPAAVGSGQVLNVDWGAVFTTLGIFMVITVLVAPLYTYMPYYLVDRRENIGGAVRSGFKDAVRNYVPLVIYQVAAAIVVSVVILVTFGLATIIILPVSLLITGHIYRQISGGSVPVEA